MLFLSSIALPAGMSAASLFCDMDMAAINSSVLPCCGFNGSHPTSGIAKDLNKESCTYAKVCTHILAGEQNEILAIPQISKEVIAADFCEKFLALSEDKRQPILFKTGSASVKYSPPIFLLNSTFLN